MGPAKARQILKRMPRHELDRIEGTWDFWARREQRPPDGDWRIWLFLGGRGAGKTRAGAEWIADGVAHVPVRFDSDALSVNLASFNAGEIPSIPLVEILI